MIRARCLRVRQHYPAQKNNQKKLHVVLKQGHNSGSGHNRGTTAMGCTARMLVLSLVDK